MTEVTLLIWNRPQIETMPHRPAPGRRHATYTPVLLHSSAGFLAGERFLRNTVECLPRPPGYDDTTPRRRQQAPHAEGVIRCSHERSGKRW
jgi:hypothetical protein